MLFFADVVGDGRRRRLLTIPTKEEFVRRIGVVVVVVVVVVGVVVVGGGGGGVGVFRKVTESGSSFLDKFFRCQLRLVLASELMSASDAIGS